jgi:hypothetical protein
MTELKTPTHLELVESAESDDPFDLAKLRVGQEFLETTKVKKLLTTVPVRTPGPHDFFRVHSSPKYRETLAFVELKEDREVYLANLAEVPDLEPEAYIATLFTAITRTGVLFMWPVRVPAADGRVNGWHLSAADAAERAMRNWVKIKANMGLGAYEISEAEGPIPDPNWPDLSYSAIYKIAFKDRLINRQDHPVLKRLRGA